MTIESLVSDLPECEPQRRHARAWPVRAPACKAVENEVDRSRRLRSQRRGSGCFGHLQHTGVGIDSPGVHGRSERLEVCLTCQRGIEWFEPSGRIDKKMRTIATAIEHERDLGVQPLQPRALKLVERGELRSREQLLGGLATPRLQLGLRGSERALSPSCRVRGQRGRSLQERSRGHDTAPARARSADCSSSAATASSRPSAACARCHARRSGSASGSVASASAWCARSRSCADAAL